MIDYLSGEDCISLRIIASHNITKGPEKSHSSFDRLGGFKKFSSILQKSIKIGPELKNLREGVMTLISPESRRTTRLGMTPASTTHWIFSFGPSVR